VLPKVIVYVLASNAGDNPKSKKTAKTAIFFMAPLPLSFANPQSVYSFQT
jgi:hypothetical protein